MIVWRSANRIFTETVRPQSFDSASLAPTASDIRKTWRRSSARSVTSLANVSAAVTISGQYFFGGPVANAKVHYKVMRSPLVHPLPFAPRLPWFDYEGYRNQFVQNIFRFSLTFLTEAKTLAAKNGEGSSTFAFPSKHQS